jgi:menaquinone-dependent protoporphyrinogen oxidase
MASLLIVYGTTEGQTRKIAERMADFARELGHTAVAVNACACRSVYHGRYDAVMVAASVHRGEHQRSVARFVRENLHALSQLPSAFFSVSLSAAGKEARQKEDARRCADAFLRETGWNPEMVRLVAGALAYTRYGLATRFLMEWIAWREGGDTDTTRDHEYTDWDQLRRDVELFVTRAVPVTEPAEAEDPVGIFAGAGI